MRLICGLLRFDGTAATETVLDGMAAAMIAGGLSPTVSKRLDGPLGLAVLDFTGAGAGPADRQGWVVAADARLDRSGSTAEAAMVEALQRHGPDFPDHVDGDFAVALWRRDTGELWLGRDFIGARPLAWTWRPGRWLAFASMSKGLHGSGLASPAIDPVALGAHLFQSYFTGADSGFADISYLQAGHSLHVGLRDTSSPRPHRAYRPDPSRVGRWRGTREQAAATLRSLVQEAVAARLPAEGPVACDLSGGLDSSAVTVLAARAARRRGGRVLALSKTMPTAQGPAELDERPLIADVLEQEKDVAHLLVHDVLPMPGLAEDIDWPGSIIDGADDRMLAGAASFGADRVLSGVGGDEGATYNGAKLYATLLRNGRLIALTRELRARARTDGISLARAIRSRLIGPLLPWPLRQALRPSPGMADRRNGVAAYLSADIVDRVLARRLRTVLQTNTPAERTLAFADHHIPSRCTYYSIMAARHGVAVSFPLLDRRVVDFILSLPVQMFLADGQSRQPFRAAMHGILPDSVRLARHKVGLFDDRFTRYADCKAELLRKIEALRATPSPVVTEIFDLGAIQAGLEKLPGPERAHLFVRASPSTLAGGMPVWSPLMAVLFLRAAWRLSAVPPGEGTQG